MSLLLFHQGNVPIIEDDMKFANYPYQALMWEVG